MLYNKTITALAALSIGVFVERNVAAQSIKQYQSEMSAEGVSWI